MGSFARRYAVMKLKVTLTSATLPVLRRRKTLHTDARKRNKTKQELQIKMVDDKLAREEAQRAANYEAIKSNVKSDVGGDIAVEAARVPPAQAARIEDVADGMRRTAVDEVVQSEREVSRARFVARTSQIVDYLFFIVDGVLTIRLLLELFAAR